MRMSEEEFTDALLAWYQEFGRDLPWRYTRDPYAVLVSEVMLQQTQVERVRVRWTTWLDRWPTFQALAAAPLREVIAAWSGLGYNRRAVALHRAAAQVVAEGVPSTMAGWRRLPGVGPYTAGAVAAFALGADVIPVDVNVARVLERRLGTPAIEPPPGRAATLTQALFDVGATICLARVPRCGACPVADGCPSRGRHYEPLRKQGRFEGSRRQARGQLLRDVQTGAVPVADADPAILAGMLADGLVAVSGDRITLP